MPELQSWEKERLVGTEGGNYPWRGPDWAQCPLAGGTEGQHQAPCTDPVAPQALLPPAGRVPPAAPSRSTTPSFLWTYKDFVMHLAEPAGHCSYTEGPNPALWVRMRIKEAVTVPWLTSFLWYSFSIFKKAGFALIFQGRACSVLNNFNSDILAWCINT